MRSFSEFLKQKNELFDLASLRDAAKKATPVQDDSRP